jgi:hypothetical protein
MVIVEDIIHVSTLNKIGNIRHIMRALEANWESTATSYVRVRYVFRSGFVDKFTLDSDATKRDLTKVATAAGWCS